MVPRKGSRLKTKTATLLCHVRVNAIGHYYNIPSLVTLANDYIDSTFRKRWSVDSFSVAAIEALSRTGDESLHSIMSDAAADHISELVQSKKFEKLKTNQDFICRVLNSCANRICHLRADLQEAQSKNELSYRERGTGVLLRGGWNSNTTLSG